MESPGFVVVVPLGDPLYNLTAEPKLQYLKGERAFASVSFQTVLVALLSLVSLVLVLPLVAHLAGQKNVPAVALLGWIAYLNLKIFANAFIWPDDFLPGWWLGNIYCDVQVKLEVGSYVGPIGCVVCILRSLANIVDVDNATPERSQAKRRIDLIWTACLVFVLPAYAMAMHFVVQAQRYAVYAITGCAATVSQTWLSGYGLLFWPLFLSLVAAWYAALIIVRTTAYRMRFAAILSASSSGMTRDRFKRLYVMAAAFLFVCLPVQALMTLRNARAIANNPFAWEAVHGEHWQSVSFVPTFGSVRFDAWVHVALGFLAFLCLGVGRDAKRFYVKQLDRLGFARILSLRAGEGNHPSEPAVELPTRGPSGGRASLLARSSDAISDQHRALVASCSAFVVRLTSACQAISADLSALALGLVSMSACRGQTDSAAPKAPATPSSAPARRPFGFLSARQRQKHSASDVASALANAGPANPSTGAGGAANGEEIELAALDRDHARRSLRQRFSRRVKAFALLFGRRSREVRAETYPFEQQQHWPANATDVEHGLSSPSGTTGQGPPPLPIPGTRAEYGYDERRRLPATRSAVLTIRGADYPNPLASNPPSPPESSSVVTIRSIGRRSRSSSPTAGSVRLPRPEPAMFHLELDDADHPPLPPPTADLTALYDVFAVLAREDSAAAAAAAPPSYSQRNFPCNSGGDSDNNNSSGSEAESGLPEYEYANSFADVMAAATAAATTTMTTTARATAAVAESGEQQQQRTGPPPTAAERRARHRSGGVFRAARGGGRRDGAERVGVLEEREEEWMGM